MGGEELKWHEPAHNRLITCKDLILVHTVQLKLKIKAQISGRMVSSSLSVAVFTSVYSEKTCQKKLMNMINIVIMKKSQ